MANRRRIVVGSLVGAAAIHLVMLACSANAPALMGTSDGGGLDAAGSDVATVDVGRLDIGSATDTGAATSDTGQQDAGFFDTLLDVVRDVIGDVVDAEVRDAHAGGDAGADAGTACACLPPPPTYTFSGTAAGLPIFGPSSAARIDVRALPPGMGPFGMPEPVVQLTVEFTAWVSRTRGPAAPTVYATVTCTGLRADATGHVVGSSQVSCRIHNNDSTTADNDNGASTTATLTTLSATQIEVRIAALTFPMPFSGSGIAGPPFTNLVFRATDPSGHFLAPLSAYVP